MRADAGTMRNKSAVAGLNRIWHPYLLQRSDQRAVQMTLAFQPRVVVAGRMIIMSRYRVKDGSEKPWR